VTSALVTNARALRCDSVFMKDKKPVTRTQASLPEDAEKHSPSEHHAMEREDQAEHEIGPDREKSTHEAAKLAEKEKAGE
jgi:hypothetical protein